MSLSTGVGNDYWVTSADHNTIAINHINGGTQATVGDRVVYLCKTPLPSVSSIHLPMLLVALGAYEAPALFKVGSEGLLHFYQFD